jgi:hypothetical protein
VRGNICEGLATDIDYPQFCMGGYSGPNTGFAILSMNVSRIFNTDTWIVQALPYFKIGDMHIDSVPAAGGPLMKFCTGHSSGTPTEAGTSTDGSNIITGMADTSDIEVGYLYTVSAGFATTRPFYCTAKTATTVSLAANATAPGACTITEAVPVWVDVYGGMGPAQTGVAAMTNLTAPANLNADTVTTAELADIVGRLIARLRSTGIVAD